METNFGGYIRTALQRSSEDCSKHWTADSISMRFSMKQRYHCVCFFLLEKEKTSKLHREFMSPALFLFKLLKMGKLTRGNTYLSIEAGNQ